jgi:hypothetical protein
MGLKTYNFKFHDKVISVKAKKDDAERFSRQIQAVNNVPSMVREISGTFGVDEHEITMQSIFGPSGTPLADPDGYAKDVQDFAAAIPVVFTTEPEMQSWAQTAADLIKKHTPIKDTRETPERAQARRNEYKRDEEERQAKRQEKEREEADAAAGLSQQYPYLTPLKASGKSRWAGGAANIRTELERAFPGVAFRVTSDSYSMGSSIDVKWTDGPTMKQVTDITGKYQTSHFDGMQDLETSCSTVFNGVFGGAKHVFESRTDSDELVLSVANGQEYNLNITTIADIPESLKYHVMQTVKDTPVIPERPMNTLLSPPRSGEPLAGVTVRLNAERNGVEILFPGKPERSVIDTLKAHGFRWSPRGKLWYAKQSDSRINFAYSLQGQEVAA